MELKSCIICYRLTPDIVGLPKPYSQDEDKENILTRFFHLLGRHLDDSQINCKDEDRLGVVTEFPFEKAIQAGMLTCQDCSGIVESFCELYHRMKSAELMLNWKVRQLKKIMQCAARFPTRVRDFCDSAAKLDMGDVTADDVLEFKTELVKRCKGKLKTPLPKLTLHRFNPNKNDTKVVAGTSTPKQTLSDCDDDVEPTNDTIIPGQPDLISSHSFAEEISSYAVYGMAGLKYEDSGNASTETHGYCPDSNNLSPLVQEVIPGPAKFEDSQDGLENNVIENDEKVLPAVKELATESTINQNSETAIPPPIIIPSGCSDKKQEDESKMIYQCPRCPELFHFRQSYFFHFQRAHTMDVSNADDHQCPFCLKTFAQLYNKKRHMQRNCPNSMENKSRNADPKTRYQCPLCLKTFPQLYNKKRHMQRNCPKSSRHKSKKSTQASSSSSAASKIHSTRADGASASKKHVYRCTACSKVFSQRDNLMRHFKSLHLQLREYACSFCTAKFSRKDNLDKHRQRVHAKRKGIAQTESRP